MMFLFMFPAPAGSLRSPLDYERAHGHSAPRMTLGVFRNCANWEILAKSLKYIRIYSRLYRTAESSVYIAARGVSKCAKMHIIWTASVRPQPTRENTHAH